MPKKLKTEVDLEEKKGLRFCGAPFSKGMVGIF